MYQDDPSPDSVISELHCWQMKWQHHLREHGQTSLPSSPTATIRHTSAMYPNIRALISILCTLPVTICSAERSFSGLKRIKTASRSSMTAQRLCGLTLIHVHRDLIEAAVDEFSQHHPRPAQEITTLFIQNYTNIVTKYIQCTYNIVTMYIQCTYNLVTTQGCLYLIMRI